MDEINHNSEEKILENPEELTAVLESLPSYESLTQNSDEPAVFDDEQEPSSGLIDLIRRNSQADDEKDQLTDSVRLQKLKEISFYSIILFRKE